MKTHQTFYKFSSLKRIIVILMAYFIQLPGQAAIPEKEEIGILYVSGIGNQNGEPLRSLKGFQRVKINPGEKKDIYFDVKVRDLGGYNFQGEKIIKSGQYLISIGGGQLSAFNLKPRWLYNQKYASNEGIILQKESPENTNQSGNTTNDCTKTSTVFFEHYTAYLWEYMPGSASKTKRNNRFVWEPMAFGNK